jgi:hypothetical protein
MLNTLPTLVVLRSQPLPAELRFKTGARYPSDLYVTHTMSLGDKIVEEFHRHYPGAAVLFLEPQNATDCFATDLEQLVRAVPSGSPVIVTVGDALLVSDHCWRQSSGSVVFRIRNDSRLLSHTFTVLDDEGRVNHPPLSRLVADPRLAVCGLWIFETKARLLRLIGRHQDFFEFVADATKSLPTIEVDASDFFDFGHVDSYSASRLRFSSSRQHHHLEQSPVRVDKTFPTHGEALKHLAWFNGLPPGPRWYTPRVCMLDGSPRTLSIEYCSSPSVTELLLYRVLSKDNGWLRLAHTLRGFLSEMMASSAGTTAVSESGWMYLQKTVLRLTEWSRSTVGAAHKDRVKLVLDSIVRYVEKFGLTKSTVSIIHGDPCFSNLLFDRHSLSLRVIDPRGSFFTEDPSIYGDPAYDVAKLLHSYRFGYDLVLAGRYRRDGSNVDFTVEDQCEMNCADAALTPMLESVYGSDVFRRAEAIVPLLFLSMLPLHADDAVRQSTLFEIGFKEFQCKLSS